MNMKYVHRIHAQKGVATLLTVVVILVVMSLMAVYVHRGALMENLLMNNLYRAKQAEEVADAALDFALAYFLANGADADENNVADTLDPMAVTNGKRATVQFCDAATSTLTSCVTPTDLTRIFILATGWSDDHTAVHRSRLLVASNPFFSGSLKAPLIVKGSTNFLGGNLTITNNTDTGTNIWTGHDIDNATGSFQTYGRVNGVDSQAISEKTGSKYYLGPDVVYNDQTLKNSSDSAFYESVIGRTMANMATSYDVKVSDCSELSSSNVYAGKIIYVTGSCALNQSLGSAASGSTILVVAGTLSISGNNTVYGSLVADTLGNITGTTTIYGSIVARSAPNNFAGNINLQMTTQSSNNIKKLTVKTVVGNSWRDW